MAAGQAAILIEQGSTFSVPIAIFDRDETTLLDLAGWTARMKVRSAKDHSTVILELTDTNGRILLGIQPADWQASTAYAVGVQVVPTTPNGFLFRCTVAGTSAAVEPTWPTTPGQTVVDGTVTWLNAGAFDAAADRYNIHLLVSATDTAALDYDERKPAVYDLELVSGSTVERILEGLVTLSKETTHV